MRSEVIKAHLAAYRKETGLTQKQMYPVLGVSYATYQALEKGIINTIDVLDKLVEKTGLVVTYKSMYDSKKENIETTRERELSDKLISRLEKEIEILNTENIRLKNEITELKKGLTLEKMERRG